MISGLHHVSIGVSDMDRSLCFYKDVLGFGRVLFDLTFNDVSMNQVVGRSVKIRMAMLENEIGRGAVKLVKLLPLYEGHRGHRPRPIPHDRRWGDAGHLEMAVEASDIAQTYDDFQKRGLPILLETQHWHIPGVLDGVYFYLKDPDGTFVEVIDQSRKGPSADFRGVNGINHMAMGVTDMDRALDFYTRILGFDILIDVRGVFPGEEVIVGQKIDERIVMLGHPHGGARIELVEILPPNQSKSNPPEKRWGDIGVMEAALEVEDIENVYRSLGRQGVQFRCPISCIPETFIRYVVIADPDDNEIGLYEFMN